MIRLFRILRTQSVISNAHLKSIARDIHQNEVPSSTPEEESKKKKKKIPPIALIGVDSNISYCTLEEATKLSVRRNFKLIKVTDFDAKRECPVYQLVAGWQSRSEDLRSKLDKKQNPSGFKSEKILVMSNRISVNDLSSKIKAMLKLVEKNHEIRVTISGNAPNDELSESIFKTIQNEIGSKARIVQKRSSGNDVKFQVIPPKITSSTTERS